MGLYEPNLTILVEYSEGISFGFEDNTNGL